MGSCAHVISAEAEAERHANEYAQKKIHFIDLKGYITMVHFVRVSELKPFKYSISSWLGTREGEK